MASLFRRARGKLTDPIASDAPAVALAAAQSPISRSASEAWINPVTCVYDAGPSSATGFGQDVTCSYNSVRDEPSGRVVEWTYDEHGRIGLDGPLATNDDGPEPMTTG